MARENDNDADARLLEKLTSAANRISTESSHRIQPLNLQPPFLIADRKEYAASDLLRYHDRDFVTNCYVAVCKRKPHEFELSTYLAKLRGGHVSKIEFIRSLSASDEGRRNQVHITGLKPSALTRLARIPVLGYFVRLLSGLARLPVIMRHQQEFETYALGQQQQIVDYVNAVRDEHSLDASVITDITEAITLLFDAMAEVSGKVAALNAELIKAREELRSRIETLRESQERTAANQQEFLIQEQTAIVATQKMVITGIEDQLKQLAEAQQQLSVDLRSQQKRLQALVSSQGFETTATGPR